MRALYKSEKYAMERFLKIKINKNNKIKRGIDKR